MPALLGLLLGCIGVTIVGLVTWLTLDARKRRGATGSVRSPEELYQSRAADTEQHRARFGTGPMDQQNWPG